MLILRSVNEHSNGVIYWIRGKIKMLKHSGAIKYQIGLVRKTNAFNSLPTQRNKSNTFECGLKHLNRNNQLIWTLLNWNSSQNKKFFHRKWFRFQYATKIADQNRIRYSFYLHNQWNVLLAFREIDFETNLHKQSTDVEITFHLSIPSFVFGSVFRSK